MSQTAGNNENSHSSPIVTGLLAALEHHADKPALRARGVRLSYHELFERAAGLSRGLRIAGIQPGATVAILSQRSTTAYVAILACVLSGVTYVPLNARFPEERNRSIFAASCATALIIDRACSTAFHNLAESLGSDVALLAPESDSVKRASGVTLSAADLVAAPLASIFPLPPVIGPLYLLFTSGTTGKPKGVPISHTNLAKYLPEAYRLAPVGAGDRVLQAADLTFDLSVHDIFLCWTTGAELCSVPEQSAILVPRIIAQNDITTCLIVPSTASRAAQEGLLRTNSMPGLRYTLFLGEALPRITAEAWRRAAPNSEIINTYGPTEATILISAYRFGEHALFDGPIVPIGWSIGDQKMAIFSEDGHQIGTDECGEILLAGSQLTDGYWHAPLLDTERFTVIDGVRWYRTGDIGRWSEHHGVLFSGRLDRQFKIRGYRVELQEIEGAVRKASGRNQVGVIPWPIVAAGTADGCVAFIAGDEGDSTRILSDLRDALPPYMVPDLVLFLRELPLNVNGKLDYVALSKDERLTRP